MSESEPKLIFELIKETPDKLESSRRPANLTAVEALGKNWMKRVRVSE